MAIARSSQNAMGFPAAITRVFRKIGLPFSELEPLLILPEGAILLAPSPVAAFCALQRRQVKETAQQ
jgi:hypothetical protein